MMYNIQETDLKEDKSGDRLLKFSSVVLNYVFSIAMNFVICCLAVATFTMIHKGMYLNTPHCRALDIGRLALTDACLNIVGIVAATANTCVYAYRYNDRESEDLSTHAGLSLKFCLSLVSLSLLLPITVLYLKDGASCKNILPNRVVHTLNAYLALYYITIAIATILACISFVSVGRRLMKAQRAKRLEEETTILSTA